MAEEIALRIGPLFAARAGVSCEYIEAFRELWTAEAPRKSGLHVIFDKLRFEPKPVQKPRPPIWVGGEVPAARRRAGMLGDGWYPVPINPSLPLGAPQALWPMGSPRCGPRRPRLGVIQRASPRLWWQSTAASSPSGPDARQAPCVHGERTGDRRRHRRLRAGGLEHFIIGG